MPFRKDPLVEGEIYHIISKSIAGLKIFNNNVEFERMRNLFRYYKTENPPLKFSAFLKIENKQEFYKTYIYPKEKMVEIIAYCLMPTHIHLVLFQLIKNGISKFMNNTLNSYSHYFNIKTKRKGPLWESRFNNVLIKTDEQLLHVTRYIHLNPVTAYLVNKPQDWKFSSYKEFLGEPEGNQRICNFSQVMKIDRPSYKKFVITQIDFQRELGEIKKLFLE